MLIDSNPKSTSSVNSRDEKIYTVRLINEAKGLNTTLKVCGNKYILDAAEVEGIQLPYSCRTGACITCTGRLVEGSVNHDQIFLKRNEEEAGFVLTCKTYPKSNCVILTHQEDDLLDL